MPRIAVWATLITVSLTMSATQSARAQDFQRQRVRRTPYRLVAQPAPIPPRSAPAPKPIAIRPTMGVQPGYPQFQASLYPTPRPDIPYQIGGAVITNQAFSPHEMLYAHEYRAIYPPYYYKVSGSWMVTPWGVWSSDSWKLQGTEVRVKYRSRINPFTTGFWPRTRR